MVFKGKSMSLRQSGPHDRSGLETGLLRGVVKAAGKFQATRSQGAHIDFRREQFETAIKYSGDGTGTFELTDRKFNKNFKLGLTQIGEGEPKQLATSEHTLLLKVRAYLSEQRAPEITVKDFLDVSGTTLKVRSEFIEILRGQVDQKRNPGDHLHANAAESKLKALRIVLDTVLGDTEIAEPEGDGDLDDEMSVDSDRSRSTTSAPPMLSFDVVEKVREKPGRRDPQLEAAQKRLIQEGVSTVPIQSGSDDGTLHHGRVGGVTLGAAGLLAVFQHGSSSAHSSVQGSPLSTGRRSDDSPLLSRAGFGEDEEDDDSVEGGFAITPAQQILFDATGVVEAMRPDDVSFTQTVRNIKGIIDNASIANPEKNRQILAQLPNGDDWTNAKTPVEFFTEAFENNFSGALIPRVYDSPRSRRSSSSSSDSDVSLPPFRGLQIVEFDDIPEEVKALRPEVLDAISEAELKTKWGEEYDTQRNKFSTYEGFRTSVAGVLNVDRVLQERGPELEEATFEVPDMENVTLANIDDMEESVLQGYWGDGYEDAKAQCEGDVGVLKEAVKDALRERQARSVMPARGRSMIPNGTRIPIHEDEEGALVLSTNPGMKNVTVRNIEAMAESKLKGYWGNGFEAARDEWGGLVLFKAEIKRQLEEKVAQKARKKAKRNAGAKVTLQEQPVTERSGVNVEATSGDIPIKQGGRAKVRAWFSWGSSKTQPAQSWQETLKDKIVKTKYAEDVTDKDKATILGDLGLAGNTLFESISEVDLKAEIIKAQGDLGPSRVAFQDSPGISPRVRAPLIEIGDHGITYTEAFTTKLKAGEVSRVALKDCDNPALMAALDIDADTLAALRKVDGDEAPELNNNNIVKRLFDGFFDDQIGLKSEEIKAVIGSGDAPGDKNNHILALIGVTEELWAVEFNSEKSALQFCGDLFPAGNVYSHKDRATAIGNAGIVREAVTSATEDMVAHIADPRLTVKPGDGPHVLHITLSPIFLEELKSGKLTYDGLCGMGEEAFMEALKIPRETLDLLKTPLPPETDSLLSIKSVVTDRLGCSLDNVYIHTKQEEIVSLWAGDGSDEEISAAIAETVGLPGEKWSNVFGARLNALDYTKECLEEVEEGSVSTKQSGKVGSDDEVVLVPEGDDSGEEEDVDALAAMQMAETRVKPTKKGNAVWRSVKAFGGAVGALLTRARGNSSAKIGMLETDLEDTTVTAEAKYKVPGVKLAAEDLQGIVMDKIDDVPADEELARMNLAGILALFELQEDQVEGVDKEGLVKLIKEAKAINDDAKTAVKSKPIKGKRSRKSRQVVPIEDSLLSASHSVERAAGVDVVESKYTEQTLKPVIQAKIDKVTDVSLLDSMDVTGILGLFDLQEDQVEGVDKAGLVKLIKEAKAINDAEKTAVAQIDLAGMVSTAVGRVLPGRRKSDVRVAPESGPLIKVSEGVITITPKLLQSVLEGKITGHILREKTQKEAASLLGVEESVLTVAYKDRQSKASFVSNVFNQCRALFREQKKEALERVIPNSTSNPTKPELLTALDVTSKQFFRLYHGSFAASLVQLKQELGLIQPPPSREYAPSEAAISALDAKIVTLFKRGLGRVKRSDLESANNKEGVCAVTGLSDSGYGTLAEIVNDDAAVFLSDDKVLNVIKARLLHVIDTAFANFTPRGFSRQPNLLALLPRGEIIPNAALMDKVFSGDITKDGLLTATQEEAEALLGLSRGSLETEYSTEAGKDFFVRRVFDECLALFTRQYDLSSYIPKTGPAPDQSDFLLKVGRKVGEKVEARDIKEVYRLCQLTEQNQNYGKVISKLKQALGFMAPPQVEMLELSREAHRLLNDAIYEILGDPHLGKLSRIKSKSLEKAVTKGDVQAVTGLSDEDYSRLEGIIRGALPDKQIHDRSIVATLKTKILGLQQFGVSSRRESARARRTAAPSGMTAIVAKVKNIINRSYKAELAGVNFRTLKQARTRSALTAEGGIPDKVYSALVAAIKEAPDSAALQEVQYVEIIKGALSGALQFRSAREVLTERSGPLTPKLTRAFPAIDWPEEVFDLNPRDVAAVTERDMSLLQNLWKPEQWRTDFEGTFKGDLEYFKAAVLNQIDLNEDLESLETPRKVTIKLPEDSPLRLKSFGGIMPIQQGGIPTERGRIALGWLATARANIQRGSAREAAQPIPQSSREFTKPKSYSSSHAPNYPPPMWRRLPVPQGFQMSDKEIDDSTIPQLRAAWDNCRPKYKWEVVYGKYNGHIALFKDDLKSRILAMATGESWVPQAVPPQRLLVKETRRDHFNTAEDLYRKLGPPPQGSPFELPASFLMTESQVDEASADELRDAWEQASPGTWDTVFVKGYSGKLDNFKTTLKQKVARRLQSHAKESGRSVRTRSLRPMGPPPSGPPFRLSTEFKKETRWVQDATETQLKAAWEAASPGTWDVLFSKYGSKLENIKPEIIKRLQTRIATQVNTGHSSGSLSGRKVPTPRPNGLPPQGPPVVLSDGFTMTVKEVEDADIDELRAAWDGSKKSGDWDKLLNRYGQNLANLKRELIRQIQRKNDGGVSSRIVSGPPSGRPPQSGRSHLRRLPSARRTSVHGSTATEGIRKQPTAFSLPTGFNLTAGQVVAKTKDELAEALGKDVPEVDSLIREYGGRDPFIEKVKALIVEGSAEMSSEKMEFSFEDMINPGFIAAQKARMQELSSKAQEDKTTDKSTRAEARLDAATEALVRQFAEEDRLARESASGGSERSSRPMTFAQSAQVSLDEIIGALAESGKLHGSALDVVVDTIYTEVGAAEAAVKLQQEEMVGASAKDRKQFEEINSFVKNSTEAAALAAKLLVKDTAFASRNFGWVANVTKAPRSGIPNSGQSCVTASAIHMMLGVLGGLDSEESSHLSKFVTGDFVTRKAGEPTDRFFKRQRLHQLFVMLMADVHDPAKSPADRQGVQFAFDIALMDYMASYNDELRVIPPSEVRELSPVVSSNSATYFRCLAHVFGLEDDFGHTTRVIVNPGAASMGYAVETSVLTELERVAADWKASDAMKAKLEFQSAMFAQGEAPSKYALVHCTTTQNPSDFQAPDQIFDKFAVQVCHPETGEIVGWRTYTPQLEAVIYRRPTGIAHFVSHCQEGEGGARRAVVYDDSKLIDLRADRARGVSSESVAAERLASIQAFKKDFYPETCVYKVQDIPLPEEDGDMSALAGYELITNDSYPECTKKVGTSS